DYYCQVYDSSENVLF
nr:immunoglobulin light chain junction region [Macaca mulatta]MOX17300.1 immunoglobulin light chain junction region [Macaca mulatta]MOX20804.1 immunoglobulin light chain junction region [Macaca mulatta]